MDGVHDLEKLNAIEDGESQRRLPQASCASRKMEEDPFLRRWWERGRNVLVLWIPSNVPEPCTSNFIISFYYFWMVSFDVRPNGLEGQREPSISKDARFQGYETERDAGCLVEGRFANLPFGSLVLRYTSDAHERSTHELPFASESKILSTRETKASFVFPLFQGSRIRLGILADLPREEKAASIRTVASLVASSPSFPSDFEMASAIPSLRKDVPKKGDSHHEEERVKGSPCEKEGSDSCLIHPFLGMRSVASILAKEIGRKEDASVSPTRGTTKQ